MLLSQGKLRTTAADEFSKHPPPLAKDSTLGVAFRVGALFFETFQGLETEPSGNFN